MQKTILSVALLAAFVAPVTAEPVIYQGELADQGAPANGRYDFKLVPHADPDGAMPLAGDLVIEDVAVENGRFRIEADFGPLALDGKEPAAAGIWLDVSVRDGAASGSFDALAGRAKVERSKILGQCWSSTGDSGVVPALNFLGTTDAQPLEFRVENRRALMLMPNAISPNVISGNPGNSVAAGVRGAVVAGGGAVSATDADFTLENINRVHSHYGTIGGGLANIAGRVEKPVETAHATVAGGLANHAAGLLSAVGGGTQNDASERAATVAGGDSNDARAVNATVGGGSNNTAEGASSVIAGGVLNRIEPGNTFGAIGGGNNNTVAIFGIAATVAGGQNNVAEGVHSSVGGGRNNTAIGARSTIAGGENNTSGNFQATVGGGIGNSATGVSATVGGGGNNFASGTSATVSGGASNSATSDGAVVSGGQGNCAGGINSWAGGLSAIVRGNGCDGNAGVHNNTFLWSDGSTVPFNSTASRQFRVLASGGVQFLTSASPGTGVFLDVAEGGWSTFSDRNAKTGVLDIDPGAILDALLDMPISSWKYKAQPAEVRHIGPMAQDFAQAFGFGSSERHISTIDADGVALAAIQGLNAKLEAENAAQRERIARLEQRLQAIEAQRDAAASAAGAR